MIARLLCASGEKLFAGDSGRAAHPEEDRYFVLDILGKRSSSRAVLQRYAEGQPRGSEVTSFPYMVEQVRASDPARADILEQGLAKELLAKLQPSMQ
ncbi:MAG: hypothetical protein KY475_20410 [Planctomycetes bacterium]|nr:hypothetical protein [Planctomycetota bacterium]